MTPIEERIEERKEEAQKEVVYAEVKIVGGCGPGKGQFSGDDFEVVNESLVHCQANKELKPVQKYHDGNGNIRIIFGAKASDCRACELSEKSLREVFIREGFGKKWETSNGGKKDHVGRGRISP